MNIRQLAAMGCLVAASFAVATLVGCGSKDAQSYVASARAYAAKADYRAAIVELKNALQKDPNHSEARVLLARALLETGDPAGAEAEVRKAIALHAPDDQTYPILARALGLQGDMKKLSAEVGGQELKDPAARSDVNVALAAAALAQGNLAKAQELIDAAVADRPDNVHALLMKANLVARGEGGLAAARCQVEAALKASPDHVDALIMLASIDSAEGKQGDAKAALQRAVDKHPTSVPAQAALFSLAMQTGNLELAKAQLEKLKQVAPKDLRTVYSDALLSATQGNNAHAREAVQRVLAAQPDNLPAQFLMGIVDYQLGSYATAEDTLRRIVAKAPGDITARRFLAMTYLRTGRAPQALEVLTPALQMRPDNPVLLRLVGEAHLASGNAELAENAYERANKIDKSDVGSQVRLAQVRLATGDTARGITDLEALAAQDSSAYQADLALFTAQLRRGEFDKALAAVDSLEKKQPNGALAPMLRGNVYLAKRDLKSARASFEKSLAIQSDYLPAARGLATIDLREGKVAAARERYETMAAKNPKNDAVLLALAEVQALSGTPPDAVRQTINKAIEANPGAVQPRLTLIGFELRRGDKKAAMAAARAASAANPDNAPLTEALGTTQLVSGETNQAVETFTKLVRLQPENPLALLRLADAQMAMKNYSGAIENERKALALRPDLPAGILALTKTYLASGKPESAIAEAHSIQKKHPDKAAGYVLEGEILLAQKKFAEGAAALKQGLDRQPLPSVATRYYGALLAAGKTSEAQTMATNWIAQHPKDAAMPLALAERQQAQKDVAAAKAGYRKVLDIDPDNVVALNNLAWLLSEDKDPKALEYAEHAHRLAPFSPNVLDTLGWTLTRTGDAKRGAGLLRIAARLAPGNAEIRLHLAKALIESGDKTAARQELSDFTKLDKTSPYRIEAEKLQATL
jgi:putative PEP-CTERM system TPR-repeat lipoprotein